MLSQPLTVYRSHWEWNLVTLFSSVVLPHVIYHYQSRLNHSSVFKIFGYRFNFQFKVAPASFRPSLPLKSLYNWYIFSQKTWFNWFVKETTCHLPLFHEFSAGYILLVSFFNLNAVICGPKGKCQCRLNNWTLSTAY